MFSTSLNCLYNLCTFVLATGILHPRPCVLFPFVSQQPCYLCQLDNRNLAEISYFLCKLFFRSNHRKCFVKKVFLKILQISLENTCVRVSFEQIVVFSIKSLTRDAVINVHNADISKTHKITFFSFISKISIFASQNFVSFFGKMAGKDGKVTLCYISISY